MEKTYETGLNQTQKKGNLLSQWASGPRLLYLSLFFIFVGMLLLFHILMTWMFYVFYSIFFFIWFSLLTSFSIDVYKIIQRDPVLKDLPFDQLIWNIYEQWSVVYSTGGNPGSYIYFLNMASRLLVQFGAWISRSKMN